ncbi:MAG: DUF2508 family protein [Oscillospiraceae bacterium]
MEGILNSFGKTFERLKPRSKAIVEKNDNEDMLAQIKEIQLQLTAAQLAFEMETDFDLIDSYVLQLDSLEKRYSYLLKKAKLNKVVAF